MCIYVCIYIYVYICMYICMYIYGIHHRRIVWSSYRKLAWVGFESMTTEFGSDALTDWAIKSCVQLCTAPPISSFLQCLISFWLLPSLVTTFIYWSPRGNHMSVAEWSDTYEIHHWRIIWSSYRKLIYRYTYKYIYIYIYI